MRKFYAICMLLCLCASANAFVIESSTHLAHEFAPWRAKDGNTGTRWASRNFHNNRPEWIMFDLGAPVPVTKISIRWEAAFAPAYKIQASNDKKTWDTLSHVTDGKEGLRKHDNLKGNGRYLRILCLEHTQFNTVSIWEADFNPEAEAGLTAALKKESDQRNKKAKADFHYASDRLSKLGVKDIIFSARRDGKDGHWYANFAYMSFDENRTLFGDGGGGLCRYNVASGKMDFIIETPNGAIRDPAVHYDAKKILFSWRKKDSRYYNLYECDINGQNIRQITDGPWDDMEPCYLPDGGIMFVSSRAKRWVNCWYSHVAVLYRCDGDGSNIRQISANIEHDNTPWVLDDGRIIFQRWEYVDRSQVHYHHLWTTNPDGTGQMVYYGNMHPGSVYIDAKPIPGTDEVLFANNPSHGRKEHTGFVAIVTDRKGPDDKSMLRNISKSAIYRDPWPLTKNDFIVSNSRHLIFMDRSGAKWPFFALPKKMHGLAIQEPRPLIKRKRESIIPPRVDLKQETGKLILADAYFGRNMKGIKPGEIKKLLVLESLPKPINYHGGMDTLTMGGSFTMERLVGTIPVEEDGSAYMELPANRAFFFVALDENNNSVKRMQSFLSVAPGEVTSCVGCHEERGKTPINKKKMGRLMALKKPANKPEPLKGIPEIMDFPRDIQPILDKHCVKCHNVRDRKANVILSGGRGPIYSHSYYMLTARDQVADGRNQARSNYPPRALGTSASKLMKKIDGSHPSKGDHKVKLSQHEQDMIRYWIESAALYPGTYAALGCGRIGGMGRFDIVKDTDAHWPTRHACAETINKRCASCHKDIPRGLYGGKDASALRRGHIAFNLSKPEESLFLLAPLSKEQGGLGVCQADHGPQTTDDGKKTGTSNTKHPTSNIEVQEIFKSKDDPGYRAILAHIQAGKKYLETEQTRFDMPNFKPRRDYLREMKRYGVLPADLDIDNPGKLNAYDIDRKYFESMWYKAK